MWNLGVFAAIGLLAGGTARLWYPGREPLQILWTMLSGMAGALIGGWLAAAAWPAAQDGELYAGVLVTALLGAVFVLTLCPYVAYVRRPMTSASPAASPKLPATTPKKEVALAAGK